MRASGVEVTKREKQHGKGKSVGRILILTGAVDWTGKLKLPMVWGRKAVIVFGLFPCIATRKQRGVRVTS